jgi:quinol monooxygenase YgiN
MQPTNPVPVLVRYTPKAGSEERLLHLVRQHWPTLRRLGLVTSSPTQVFRGEDKRTGRISILEIFEWRDDTSSETAHQTPEVMAVWEPMGPLLESMELTRLERV